VARDLHDGEVDALVIEGHGIALLHCAVDPVGHTGRWPDNGKVEGRKRCLGQEVLNATDVVCMVVCDENAREQEPVGLEVRHHGASLAGIDHHQLVAAL
jgi:hypothetical protein